MQSSGKGEKIRRDDLILAGIIDANSEDIVDGSANQFAFFFIELLKKQNIKVYPIDASRLNIAKNKLAYLMKSQKVMGDFFYLESNWHKLDLDNFLGFYEEDGSPVLVVHKGARYYYVDPYNNTSVLVTEENKDRIRSFAYFVYPSADSQSMPELLWSAIRYCRKELIIYLALVLLPFVVGGALALGFSLFQKSAADIAVESSLMVSACVALLAVTAVFFVNIVVARTNFRFATKVRSCSFPAILKHFFSLKSSDEKRMSRELVTTFISFVDAIEAVLNNGLNGMQYLIYSILCVVALRFISSGIERPFMDMLIIYLLLSMTVCIIFFRLAKKQHDNQETLSAVRKEIIDSMDVIKCNAAEDRFFHRFAVAYGRYLTCRLKMDHLSSQPLLIANAVNGFGMFLMFILIYEHADRTISASGITIVVALLSMLMSFLIGLINSAYAIIQNVSFLSFGSTVLKGEAEKTGEGVMGLEMKGKIEFSHVDYSYDGGNALTLRDISFVIEPGEYVAIVGESGSGKSTMIRLLLGFDAPRAGNILIDDIDISRIDLQSMRKQMGVVLQNEGIINGSVKLNIGMEEEPDMEKVASAARLAAIAEEIEHFPMKYYTILSNESELVSGGQKQRIVLARALVNNPKILILDEATSALDNITQDMVKKNLDHMGVTRIVVAHRLSTIVDCDKIIVLDGGTICEMGTFRELMDKNGVFARMAQRNLL